MPDLRQFLICFGLHFIKRFILHLLNASSRITNNFQCNFASSILQY